MLPQHREAARGLEVCSVCVLGRCRGGELAGVGLRRAMKNHAKCLAFSLR